MDALRDATRASADALRARMPHADRVRHGFRVPGDPAARVPQDGEVAASVDAKLPTFDAMLEVGGEALDYRELIVEVASESGRLGSLVDVGRSTAPVGVEHRIIDGDQPLVLFMAMRRLASWSQTNFSDYWLNVHGPEAKTIVPDSQGYRQLHPHRVSTRDLVRRLGYGIDDLDGVAEGHHQSEERFLEVLSRPAVAADHGFIDHAGTTVALYEVTNG